MPLWIIGCDIPSTDAWCDSSSWGDGVSERTSCAEPYWKNAYLKCGGKHLAFLVQEHSFQSPLIWKLEKN